MKKVIIIIVVIALLYGLTWAILYFRAKHQRTTPYMREATLYAITTNNIPVFKDETGKLWEIRWLTDISAQDQIMIEIINGKISRTWVLVAETETGN